MGTCPEELISRLKVMSKEGNIIARLIEENNIKENGQPQTKAEKAKSKVVTQPETTTKDTVGRNTSAMEQVETPNASATQLKADVGEGVTIHADDLFGNKVHKLEENLEAKTKKVINEEPETKTIIVSEPEQASSECEVLTKPHDTNSAEEEIHEEDRIPNTTTIDSNKIKVSATKIKGAETSGSPAQTAKVHDNAPAPGKKGAKETPQQSLEISKERAIEAHKEATRLSKLRDENILKKHKMLEIQEIKREYAKTTLQEETERRRQIKMEKKKKKKLAKKATSKERQGKEMLKTNSNTKIKRLDDQFESLFNEVGLDIQDFTIYKANPDGACGSNCVALAFHHDERLGQYVRRDINSYIVKHGEYQKQFMAFPHTQMVGKEEITFEEDEYLKFLGKNEKSGKLWMDYTDLQAVANYYQVSVHVLTTDVKNVKGSKARWTHLEPDARMKIHSPITQELPDVWMLHVDNTHFDLIIKKDNRLATEGGLEQSNSSGPQDRTMEIKANKQSDQKEEPNPHKAIKTKMTRRETSTQRSASEQNEEKDDNS